MNRRWFDTTADIDADPANTRFEEAMICALKARTDVPAGED